MQLKTKSKELQKVWPTLCEIFDKSKGLTKKDINRLNSLEGFKYVYDGKHPKLYIEINGKKAVITLSSSPSDYQWGRQTLRLIHKVFESEEW